jgi:hypothetical protein
MVNKQLTLLQGGAMHTTTWCLTFNGWRGILERTHRFIPSVTNLLFCLALTYLLAGCNRHVVSGPIPQVPVPPPPPSEPYRSSISAGVTGSITGEGLAGRGHSHGPKTTLSERNKAVQFAEGASGNEEKECGPTHVVSQSRATGHFLPHVEDERRMFGFGLSVSAFAQAGLYQTRKVKIGWCSGMYVTEANAKTSGVGRVHFTYAPPAGIRDQVILTISTPTLHARPRIRVDGPNGPVRIEKRDTDTTFVVDLVAPGVYTLNAETEVSVRAASRRQGHETESVSQTRVVELGIQSLRDALAFGFSRPGFATGRFTVTALLPDTAIKELLLDELFTNTSNKAEERRFYPCQPPTCKSKELYDMYLIDPHVYVEGGALVVAARLDGSIPAWIIPIGISGDVKLWGAPVVQEQMVRLNNVVLDAQSRNLLVQYGASRFADTIAIQIHEAAVVDLKPMVDSAKVAVSKLFPIRLNQMLCFDANLEDVRLEGITVQQAPRGGVLAYISFLTTPGTAESCADRSRGTDLGGNQVAGMNIMHFTEAEARAILREVLGIGVREENYEAPILPYD